MCHGLVHTSLGKRGKAKKMVEKLSVRMVRIDRMSKIRRETKI